MNEKYIRADLFMNRIAGKNLLTSEEIKFALEQEPSEDVAPVVHAHWIPYEDEYEDKYTCSACGGTQFLAIATPQDEGWEYCPECGAKMDGGVVYD